MKRLVLAAAALLLLAARTAAPAEASPRLGVWCEFMPYTNVVETLPLLAQYRCDLVLHVGRGDLHSKDLALLCRAARDAGVPVTAWFLLPYDEHLYVGEETIASTRDLAMSFVAWAKRDDLRVDRVVFDCEPSPLLGRRLFAAVRRGNLPGLVRLLRRERNPRRFEESVNGLNAMIDDLHAQGIEVSGAANRVFLDFLHYGDTGIQDALNAPFTMVKWDAVSFITYRYHASQAQYVAMIKRYAELAHRFFGERAGLDLGLLGDQRNIPEHRERAELFGGGNHFMSYLEGMRSVYDLQEVVGVAMARGVYRINLYSLEGALDSVAGLEFWLRSAAEGRPLGAWETWTPVSSVRCSASGWILHRLFRLLVRAPRPAAKSP